MKNERTIIVGGPRRGKSTLAMQLAYISPPPRDSYPTVPIRCGDPLSKVKDPLPGVEYLPEGLPFAGDDGAAQWIADNWFELPGPWVCEGHVMARALRRWLQNVPTYGQDAPMREHQKRLTGPADRIIVLDHEPWVESTKGQEAMHKGVMSVWQGIAHHFYGIVECRAVKLGLRRSEPEPWAPDAMTRACLSGPSGQRPVRIIDGQKPRGRTR